MWHAGRNLDSLLGVQTLRLPRHFEFCRSLQHKEELARMLVVVPHLGCPWRHSFVDHTERLGFNQVPAIALLAPQIMFGVGFADHIRNPTLIAPTHEFLLPS